MFSKCRKRITNWPVKDQFPGYFQLPEATIKKIWKEGVFSFDANFLLNFYRYSKETRAEVFKIVGAINDRVWVSHQATLEFLRNRLDVIAEQDKTYDAARKDLKDLESRFKTSSRHPFVGEGLLKQMSALFTKLDKELEDRKNEFTKLGESDDIQDDLVKLLDGKVGSPFPEKRLNEIFQEGEKRYKDKIPPGFKDQVKDGEKRKFGDLVLWFQLIDKAATEKKPVIFITDDAKEDWWWKSGNKTIGPRPELVEEIKAKAGVDFYIYSSDRFMQFAHKYLNQTVEKSAIEEVKEVRKSSAELVYAPTYNNLLAEIAKQYYQSPQLAKTIADMTAMRNLSSYLDPSISEKIAALSGISGLVPSFDWSKYAGVDWSKLIPPSGISNFSEEIKNAAINHAKPKQDTGALEISVGEKSESSPDDKPAA
jgi:PIN like domain